MLDAITGSLTSILAALPPFLLVLTLVVFVHEMGHYLVGRWCGIHAVTFSVGFGRELLGFTDRHGTRWRLSLIPLGGYVKFLGDEDATSRPANAETLASMSVQDRGRAFADAALWRRAATVAAGPIANFLLAIAIFGAVFWANGRMVADPVISTVQEGSAAEEAGLMPGDRFVALDGNPVSVFDDIQRYVAPRPSIPILVTVERDSAMLDLTVTPRLTEITDRFGNKVSAALIGVTTDDSTGNFRRVEFTLPAAIAEGAYESWHVVARTVQHIGNVFAGREKPDQIGGPIRVGKYAKDVSAFGFVALMTLAAGLSVSIGFLNLLPVPMLDGGHLVFYAWEAVTGRPPAEAAQEWAYRIGLTLILSLMVFATWNDFSFVLG